jgi:ParB family chromosome partitioning protein
MPRRSGLGRGLDALLPTGREISLAEEALPGGLREISVASVLPNPDQPRTNFDLATLQELADSIRELGVLQPLLVRAIGDTYELIAGERRWRAAQLAGLETVPALLVETDRAGSLERALVENIQREDLNPLEEAAAYRQLLDEAGMTQDALAQRLGRSPQAISNVLRLLDLPVTLQRYVADGLLTEGHARALLGLEGNPLVERVAKSVITDGLSVRATEDLVRRYRERFGQPAFRRGRPPIERSPVVVEAERRLNAHLQARVRIDVTKKKRRVVIEAVSDEDLQRITDAIVGSTHKDSS